jgi:16S rRNA (guanine527-N7)-methyltransferase
LDKGSPEYLLRDGLEQLGAPADDALRRRLMAYLDLLSRWNRSYNLTAVREPAGMVTKHLLDSLSILPWAGSGRLLDAGTGAGLPGIPLAMALPGLEVTLVDSAGKKVRFMNHVKRELLLDNVHPVQARVESFEADAPFDTVVSRAFTRLVSFVSAVRGLADETTRLLAMKGRFPAEELEELPEWARLESVEKLSVPGLHEHRHLVIMSVSP